MSKLSNLLKTIGPGILFAGAAIGASHIVQSTRAGANYGFALLIFVILSNIFKYPFFEYGQRYTAATGESIIDGYGRLGKWEVNVFYILNHFTAVISTAGVTLVTAALSSYLLDVLFGIKFQNISDLSIIILITVIILLLIGKYSALDKIVKTLIVVLSITTVIAFTLALGSDIPKDPNFIEPDLFNIATYGFLIALMGWMPAPIEASSWSSVWMIERRKETGHTPSLKESLLDFKIGYIGTAILACFFLGLGALIMYGSGESFDGNAIQFTKQVISLYTATLGDWSLPIISIVALVTMASTTMTVVDAYPRTLAKCVSVYKGNEEREKRWYVIYLLLVCLVGFFIINYFSNQIKAMIDFATTISFLAAPVFSYLNFKIVKSEHTPEFAQPSSFLRILSNFGLVFLVAFSLFFIYIQVSKFNF